MDLVLLGDFHIKKGDSPFWLGNKLQGFHWKNLNINYHTSYSLQVAENEIASHDQTNWQQLSFISQQSRQTWVWSNSSNVHVYLIEGDVSAIWCIWHTNCWLKHLIIENVGLAQLVTSTHSQSQSTCPSVLGQRMKNEAYSAGVEENGQKCTLANDNSWVYLGCGRQCMEDPWLGSRWSPIICKSSSIGITWAITIPTLIIF